MKVQDLWKFHPTSSEEAVQCVMKVNRYYNGLCSQQSGQMKMVDGYSIS